MKKIVFLLSMLLIVGNGFCSRYDAFIKVLKTVEKTAEKNAERNAGTKFHKPNGNTHSEGSNWHWGKDNPHGQPGNAGHNGSETSDVGQVYDADDPTNILYYQGAQAAHKIDRAHDRDSVRMRNNGIVDDKIIDIHAYWAAQDGKYNRDDFYIRNERLRKRVGQDMGSHRRDDLNEMRTRAYEMYHVEF